MRTRVLAMKGAAVACMGVLCMPCDCSNWLVAGSALAGDSLAAARGKGAVIGLKGGAMEEDDCASMK
jgi:hypothetical protein